MIISIIHSTKWLCADNPCLWAAERTEWLIIYSRRKKGSQIRNGVSVLLDDGTFTCENKTIEHKNTTELIVSFFLYFYILYRAQLIK